MDASYTWRLLMEEANVRPIELQTKRGLNFIVGLDGRQLIVQSSLKQPASKLKAPRPISEGNFKKVFPLFARWKKGERGISKELTAITVNSVYIMAMIDYVLTTIMVNQ